MASSLNVMSIRLRLTIWYVLLLAVILGIFSGGLYVMLSYSLRNEVDRTLETRAKEVQNSISAALAVQSDPRGFFSRGRLTLLPAADTFATPGVYVQVQFDTTGGPLISRSDNLGDKAIDVPAAALARVKQGDSIYVNSVIDSVPLRVYISPLRFRDQTIGEIEVAQSLRGVDETLRQVATLLAGGILTGLALAFLVGAFLGRNALTPIDRVTQTARGITRAGDLTRRIEPTYPQDEVGRLAATFNEMLGRIEELFRAQQRFVADVSHELRSPLTAIRGNLDLLRRGAADDPEARHQALAAIDAESERMQRLVSDLLLLARSDEGVTIQKQSVELDTILLDVYREARVMANGVKVCLGHEDQAQVMGDPDRLKQLFLNLVDNAIKYTPSGGEVTLSLDCDAPWVRVSVADTGVGIPAHDLPRIFDRFYRVDKARARGGSTGAVGGTGLGLAIAKWIVEAHDGRVEVQSQVGKGTTFTVWLPLEYANGAHLNAS
ncbi:MAG: HAMP domain-containing protein [Chloroflexi bacterium]|nr:HAMP domain-containing protein [Chloroflexota bacterium]